MPNHQGGLLGRFRSFLEEVGRRAPGSYGVVYFRDTDFATGDHHVSNHFQRMVIRRGVVEVVDDVLFNPVVPTIEDP